MRGIVPAGFGLLAAVIGCMVLPRSAAHDAVHALLAPTILAVAVVLASLLVHAYRHHMLATGLARHARRGVLAGEPVHFVTGLRSPLVAGLWRPRIFSGEDLASRLDDEELEAVMFHERHHRLDRAPLRILVLATLSPLVGRIARGRAWLERELARIEIAADRHALAAGASRAAIASALLKLPPIRASAGAAGFATAAELRVRALLGEPVGLDPERSFVSTGLLAVVAASCLVAYLS